MKKLGLAPKLIVDLIEQQENVEAYLKEHGIQTNTYFVPTKERDRETLSDKVCEDLDKLIKKFQISHAVISTEPKAHYAYLQYFITRKIPTLTDKPITCPVDVANCERRASLIKKQYNNLLSLIDLHKTKVVVQCQRRYDIRYQWIKSTVTDLIKKYKVPVHNIQIYHSDGSFWMPDEMLVRENHPYKHGYGKLFHSGYHFIDLLTMMLSFEDLPPEKRPTSFDLISSHFSPQDQLFSMDEKFYETVFPNKTYSGEFEKWQTGKYKKLGELDLTTIIQGGGKEVRLNFN
ncbi:MAG: Gfo/Idh/MocA family oxidoreductase [Verrucomicrobia bacterium]|nr:Gfo/Idh/MocA family oxidoreductase [Verrucomicrobiota bacterium]